MVCGISVAIDLRLVRERVCSMDRVSLSFAPRLVSRLEHDDDSESRTSPLPLVQAPPPRFFLLESLL